MPLSRFDPARYFDLLSEKESLIRERFAAFTSLTPDIFASKDKHFRYRAEFRFWHDGEDGHYVLFSKGDSKNPIRIEQFPIGSELINEAMTTVKTALLSSSALKERLFQVEFLTSTKGECLVTLIYHKRLDEQWELAARALADKTGFKVIGRSRKQKLILDEEHILETLRVDGKTWHYQQRENSFTQPNPYINEAMLNWVTSQLERTDSDFLELYCGNGNFTLPISAYFNRVIATEISKSSIASAKTNCTLNQATNIQFLRLSSEEFTEAYSGKRAFRRLNEAQVDLADFNFSTVLVDPPRAGLDIGTLNLISQFDRIIYISCNPDTLIDNLSQLNENYIIERWAIFDQFPYTNHLETGVMLSKKAP